VVNRNSKTKPRAIAFDTRGRRNYKAPFEIENLNSKSNNTIMAISVGSKAPDFTLKSKQASGVVDVKLSNNFGKKNTVLLFFPLAFTSVCTKEMCDITAGLNGYSGLNADVIAVSVDSPFAQEAWAQKEKIGITLASDLNKEVIKKYDVVFPMLAGVGDTAARAAFVIDKNGVVQYSEQTPTPKDLPNFEAVKTALGKLK
jgi:peroxiredoxin